MSELHVPLTTVDAVRPHPNADRLDIAIVKGWQVAVAKDSVSPGDAAIYVPPDAIVPDQWADTWGVAPYLGKGNRVRSIKLRGEPSFGFLIPLKGKELGGTLLGYTFEDNVANAFGITKYKPPLREFQGRSGGTTGAIPEDPYFTRYTEIENLRHMPGLFDGVEVVITEKIHGANSRVGVIGGHRVAGSRRVQRENPAVVRDKRYAALIDYAYDKWYKGLPFWKRWAYDYLGVLWPMPRVSPPPEEPSLYWKPFEIEGVRELLTVLGRLYQQVILYGELYGPNIQALGYGIEPGKVGYVAFDLMLDGSYVGFSTFEALCKTFQIPMAPVLAEGRATLDEIRQLSEGPTLLNGGPHYREGVVVKACSGERRIAKFVSDTYLTGGDESAEDLASDAGEVPGCAADAS